MIRLLVTFAGFFTGMNWYQDENWVEWIDRLSDDDFLVIDDFLPKKTCGLAKHFLSKRLKEDEFEKAGLGPVFNNQVVSSIRGDFTYWLERQRDIELEPLFSLITEAIEKLNEFCFLSLNGYEFHFAHYPPGTYYKKHVDQFKERSNRIISVIIYLNDTWVEGDGGELKLYTEKQGEILVEPKLGRCVMFKSEILEHEVLFTNIDRYSITGWLLYRPSSVGYLLT